MSGKITTPLLATGALVWLLAASPAMAGGACPNAVCEPEVGETCVTCPDDCECPPATLPPATTTTLAASATTTLPEPSGACCSPEGACTDGLASSCLEAYQGDNTTCAFTICPTPTTLPPETTLPPPPPSTLAPPTTIGIVSTTTLPVTGACCSAPNCSDVTPTFCEVGTYKGDGTSCSDTDVCRNCGNSCIDFGETCDDGNTASGDGCSATCLEEACYTCNENNFLVNNRIPFFGCTGQSSCALDGSCEVCGDETVGVGEQCDDGNTANGDCCSSTCQFENNGAVCDDDNFCNGADACNGAGLCVNGGTPASCAQLDGACTVGKCDLQADACVADLDDKNGQACNDASACTAANSGVCNDGVCAGTGTTLSPSCRWIIVAGAPSPSSVRVRTGRGSTMDASACGDTARVGGITTGNFVANAATGQAMRFEAAASVSGDAATGGGTIDSTLYGTLPGTMVKSVAGGQMMAKTPSGAYNAIGNHPLIDVCSDDQDKLEAALPILNAKVADDDLQTVKVGIGSAREILVPAPGPDGVSTIDVQSLRLARKSTLTITGPANSVVMIRVLSGRLIAGYQAKIVLNGPKPENVLFYSKWRICRMAPGSSGAGTVFCPGSLKFQIGAGVTWSGSFLGGTREIRAKSRAELTHVPFLGF